MPTPFAYNTGTTISGTTQIGNLARGTNDMDYSANPGNVQWWMSPDESTGYVIALTDEAFGHTSPVGINNIGLSFRRSSALTDDSFVEVVNHISGQRGYSGVTNSAEAKAYIDTIGFTTFTGYEAESLALFARMTGGTPTEELKELINKTIKDIKDAGIWSNLDWLYIVGLHTEQASTLNWISNQYNLIAVDSPQWDAGTGFTGNGTSYLKNGWKESLHAIKFDPANSNCSIGYYKWKTNTASSDAAIGTRIPGLEANKIISNGSNVQYYGNSEGFSNTASGDASYPHLGVGYRDTGNKLWAYKAQSITPVQSLTKDVPYVKKMNTEMYFLSSYSELTLTSYDIFGAWFAGGNLGTTGYDTLYTIIKYFYDNY